MKNVSSKGLPFSSLLILLVIFLLPIQVTAIEPPEWIRVGTATNVRASYGLSANPLFEASVGEVGTVMEGPEESDGFTWWYIYWQNHSQYGWAAEGNNRLVVIKPDKPKTNNPGSTSSGSAPIISSLRPTFEWTLMPKASSYEIYWSENRQGADVHESGKIDHSPDSSWRLPSSMPLKPNTVYVWDMVAKSSAGESPVAENRFFKTPNLTPELVFLSIDTLSDDNEGESQGNGDGIVNPGEKIELDINIANIGNMDSSDGTLSLSTESEYVVHIDDTPSTLRGIDIGDDREGSGDFDILISDDCPDNTEITFTLTMETPEGLWEDTVSFTVYVDHPPAEKAVLLSPKESFLSKLGKLTLSWTIGNTAEAATLYFGPANEPIEYNQVGDYRDTIATLLVNEYTDYICRIDTVNPDGEITVGDVYNINYQRTNTTGPDGCTLEGIKKTDIRSIIPTTTYDDHVGRDYNDNGGMGNDGDVGNIVVSPVTGTITYFDTYPKDSLDSDYGELLVAIKTRVNPNTDFLRFDEKNIPTGNDNVTVFAGHLSKIRYDKDGNKESSACPIPLAIGDKVIAGETPIGYIADSGHNGGYDPHVHIGILPYIEDGVIDTSDLTSSSAFPGRILATTNNPDNIRSGMIDPAKFTSIDDWNNAFSQQKIFGIFLNGNNEPIVGSPITVTKTSTLAVQRSFLMTTSSLSSESSSSPSSWTIYPNEDGRFSFDFLPQGSFIFSISSSNPAINNLQSDVVIGAENIELHLQESNLAIAPYVEQIPEKIHVDEGSQADIRPIISGTGPIQFEWKKDGTTVVSSNLAPLVVPSASSQSDGLYTLNMSNNAGNLSTNIVLIVHPKLKSNMRPNQLFWTAAFSDWSLEETTDLQNPNWIPAQGEPNTDGSDKVFTPNSGGTVKFYRLLRSIDP